jgi:hypothetical protein
LSFIDILVVSSRDSCCKSIALASYFRDHFMKEFKKS